MKKSFAFISLAGLLFAACHSNISQNSANSANDSIASAMRKDSLLRESMKLHVQDSLDALKKDTGKKTDTAKAK